MTAHETHPISSYNFVASNARTFLPSSLKMGSKVERLDKTVYFLSFRKKVFQHCTLTLSG